MRGAGSPDTKVDIGGYKFIADSLKQQDRHDTYRQRMIDLTETREHDTAVRIARS
jgi:hypothetical protein